MKTLLNLIIILWTGTVLAGTYNGGSGTEAKPYKISNVGNWQELMNTPSDWDKHFILTNNLLFLMGADLTPVGSENQPFTGVVDGQGYYLMGTKIEQPADYYVGLFGYIGSGGHIKNLGTRIPVKGKLYVGGLAGYSLGTLTNCYATGSVSGGGMYAGGLVGYKNSDSTTSFCYATGSVSSSWYVGGLIGLNGQGTVISCYATGQVNGNSFIGGLVGYNHYSEVSSCYATGAVSGTEDKVGGLVGYDYGGAVVNSFASGAVSGGSEVGGLAGCTHGTLTHCYAVGSVKGTTDIGGLAGIKVSETYYPIIACFWDTQTSGLTDGVGNQDPDSASVMGKTSAQMKSLSTFAPAEWDFINVWGIIPNQTYPYLRTDWIADLNHDKKVDLADFEIFASQWLRQ